MSRSPQTTPLDDLTTLTVEVDRGFAETQARQGLHMLCRAGCSDCCRARLSVTRVEEERLRRGLATLADERREQFAERTRDVGREMCPALDADGRCGVYPWRPLICRSFGVPLRHRHEVELIRPPIVDVCDLNFTEVALPTLPAEDVMEHTVLEDRLRRIDDRYCNERGLPRGQRVALASILG